MGEWRLGSYELLRRLGEGGMAQVYLARDIRLGREVAVKVLDRKLAERPGFRERFMREARVAAALDHPNIVPLFDFGDTEALYLVMPYVSGGSLQDLLPRAPLPIGEVVTYGSQMADALEYAHQRKVVHRDVKPANMLLHADGRLMLSDFGLAKIVNATHSSSSQAPRSRPDAGTPEYMAPEQVTGNSDSRSDIYGLGVVLYLLLTGRLPFSGSSSREVMQAHLYKEPKPLRRYNPAVPTAMEAVVMRAMAKQPAERFQRAGELGAALLSALIADADDAPTFSLGSSSHGGSRPTGQAPVINPVNPYEQPTEALTGVPPWLRQHVSQPTPSAPALGGFAQELGTSAGRGSQGGLPGSLGGEWSVERASALTGALPDLNTPFTSLATGPSPSGSASGAGQHAGGQGPSATRSGASAVGDSGVAGGGLGSFASLSGFTDSQTIGGVGGAPGVSSAYTLGRMPVAPTPFSPPYAAPFPESYPPSIADMGGMAGMAGMGGAMGHAPQGYPEQPTAGAQGMQGMQSLPGGAFQAAPMTPMAPMAPSYPAPQPVDLRATLPGSHMTEPPPMVEPRERRSRLWIVIAILLIVMLVAVVALLRWLEAGAAGFLIFGAVRSLLTF